jgi:HSP20 family protein
MTSIYLKRLHGRLGDVAFELRRWQFAGFASPDTWQPAINAYRCKGQITICVDLAGVEREALDLRVDARRLSIRGHREAPEPAKNPEMLQVLAMEIDYGAFERQFELPADVDVQRIMAEQRNGLLWIYLPLRPES